MPEVCIMSSLELCNYPSYQSTFDEFVDSTAAAFELSENSIEIVDAENRNIQHVYVTVPDCENAFHSGYFEMDQSSSMQGCDESVPSHLLHLGPTGPAFVGDKIFAQDNGYDYSPSTPHSTKTKMSELSDSSYPALYSTEYGQCSLSMISSSNSIGTADVRGSARSRPFDRDYRAGALTRATLLRRASTSALLTRSGSYYTTEPSSPLYEQSSSLTTPQLSPRSVSSCGIASPSSDASLLSLAGAARPFHHHRDPSDNSISYASTADSSLIATPRSIPSYSYTPPSPSAVLRRRPSLPVTTSSYYQSLLPASEGFPHHQPKPRQADEFTVQSQRRKLSPKSIKTRRNSHSSFSQSQEAHLMQHQQSQHQQQQQQQPQQQYPSDVEPMINSQQPAPQVNSPSTLGTPQLYRTPSAQSNYSTASSSSPNGTPYHPRGMLSPTEPGNNSAVTEMIGQQEDIKTPTMHRPGFQERSPSKRNRPAPLNLEASPNRRRPSRLSIDVPSYTAARARNASHPYPTPGSLASPLDSPFQFGPEAGSNRPLSASEQAASEQEMAQLLGQLDSFLVPDVASDHAPSPPTLNLPAQRRGSLQIGGPRPHSSFHPPTEVMHDLTPPQTYGMASFEISGVTLNEEDLELLDGPDFEIEDRAYPASAPAWQTSFNLGPNGPNVNPMHPQNPSYQYSAPQYNSYVQQSYPVSRQQPQGYHEQHRQSSPNYSGWNAPQYNYGKLPPTPSTPQHLNTPNSTLAQRRTSIDPPLSAPLRRRRSSDDISAYPHSATYPRGLAAPYPYDQQNQRPTYPISEQIYDPSRNSHPRTMVGSSPPITPTTPKSPTKRARTTSTPAPPKGPTSPTKPTSPVKTGGALPPMFVNYSASDKKKLLAGVAPSGSSKRKREEAEAAARAAAAASEAAKMKSQAMGGGGSSSSNGSVASSAPSSINSMAC